ncbi:hypothetical protein [Paenibacillus naphthalenovorans]|uniref:hypothetical protein n=1 Tax=Paenibacillus naphthalenovorans TaxID=162209 RepID=UPI00158760B5|nr:hypothetical protein [Paenibacillus naphthalenovorans]
MMKKFDPSEARGCMFQSVFGVFLHRMVVNCTDGEGGRTSELEVKDGNTPLIQERRSKK